jgi:hypothetical protein
MSTDKHLNQAVSRIESRTSSLVLPPDLYGYDQARKIFNTMLDRAPSAIIRPRSTDDARSAAQILVESEVPFTLRGGGHSIAGSCTRDGAVMLDLSLLRRVEVDPSTRLAKVEPGAIWGDFDRATTLFGLAATGGIVSHTGVGGLILGGGLGWLMGEMGLACDNLVEVEVIDGEGNCQTVDEGHPDLRYFRGAGRGLGVVTSYTIQCRPIPEQVSVGRVIVDLDATEELWAEMAQAHDELPPELTPSPVIAFINGRWCAGLDFVATLSHDEVRSFFHKYFPSTTKQLYIRQEPYAVVQRMLDTEFRFGRRNYWKSIAVSELSVGIGEALATHFKEAPSSQTFLSIDVLHNRAQSEPSGGSSYSLRDKPYVILFNTIWQNPVDDSTNIDWCRAGFDLLRSQASERSTYSNYFSFDDVGVQDGSNAELPEEVRVRWKSNNLMT